MSVAPTPVAVRSKAAWFALALLPVLSFVVLHFLGFIKFARLGAIGLVAVSFASVMFLRPRWGLYFLLFYVYSGIGLFMPVNLAAPVLAIVVAAVLLEWIRGHSLGLPDAFFWIVAALFVFVSLLSMLVAHDIGASFRELVSFGKILLVIVLIVHLIRTAEQLRTLCYVVFIGAVSTVVLGVLGIAAGLEGAGENYIGGVHIMRFTGVHENPNKAAAYMCSALPLGIFAAKHCVSRVARVAFALGVIILFVAIFATFSRSVVIALTVVLIGIAVHELRSRPRSFWLLGILIAMGLMLAPRYYWERVVDLPNALRDTTQDWSVYTRLLALQTAWEMFLDHPLTGVGLGNFLGASAYRLFVRIVVHNTYLEILVGTGIVGLSLFLAMLGSGLRHAIAGARRGWSRHPAWMPALSYYVTLSALAISLSAAFATMPFRYPLWVPVAAGLVIGNLLRAEKRA